jgi:hypothetical protein
MKVKVELDLDIDNDELLEGLNNLVHDDEEDYSTNLDDFTEQQILDWLDTTNYIAEEIVGYVNFIDYKITLL